MKFENTEVFNIAGALRGMRNPLESWKKSDSQWVTVNGVKIYNVGDNDIDLATRLIKAGEPHRKFMRQIFISVDITAPIYWWKEFDTYKVGTVANSTSTMHKLASTPITMRCFEMDDFDELDKLPLIELENVRCTMRTYWEWALIPMLEKLRQKYNETKDKRYWKELIRLLPESWLQTRTVTMNYENVLNMVKYREGHKLTEWSKSFMEWAHQLPFSEVFIFQEVPKNESVRN